MLRFWAEVFNLPPTVSLFEHSEKSGRGHNIGWHQLHSTKFGLGLREKEKNWQQRKLQTLGKTQFLSIWRKALHLTDYIDILSCSLKQTKYLYLYWFYKINWSWHSPGKYTRRISNVSTKVHELSLVFQCEVFSRLFADAWSQLMKHGLQVAEVAETRGGLVSSRPLLGQTVTQSS